MSELQGDEWEIRFKERIVERLTQVGNVGGPVSSDTNWTVKKAREAAEAELEVIHEEGINPGFENDPEGAADEALEAWEE